jgi:hypothetical protein
VASLLHGIVLNPVVFSVDRDWRVRADTEMIVLYFIFVAKQIDSAGGLTP